MKDFAMSIMLINYEQDIESIEYVWRKNNRKDDWKNVDDEIKLPYTETYLKKNNGLVVAFIVITKKGFTFSDIGPDYIFEIFACPTEEGYGSELIEEMQKERQFLYLHAKKTNDSAIGCYQKNGFVINGQNLDNTKHRMVWEKSSGTQE